MPRNRAQCWGVANVLHAEKVGVRGEPRIVPGVGPWSTAVGFDGRRDGLVVAGNPLSGAMAFTLEAVFKPEPDGQAEQRFVHLQSAATADRVLLELRSTSCGWYADTFLKSGEVECVLAEPTALHAWSQWHVLTLVCDGVSCESRVNGVLQARQRLVTAVDPMPPGDVSLGQRMNAVSPFRGAMAALRCTPWARPPGALWTASQWALGAPLKD